MAFAKPEVYEFDRRHFLRLTGAMGVAAGSTFILPEELLAKGACEKIVTENGGLKANQAGATLQFWIDGLHFGDRTDLKSRANITLFMNISQTANTYVESVVLMDPAKKLLAARYFDSTMKMKDHGYVPYVRFENIQLDHEKDYYCVYSTRSGSVQKVYVSKISKPKVSQLNTTWLPQPMRDDFKFFLLDSSNKHKAEGLITTQFQFYTLNGLTNHCARGKVTEMSSDGKSFKVNIDFMHQDLHATHYMRYFIVMDPVGRLLGVVKRTGPGDLGMSNGSLDVTPITDTQITDLKIPPLQVANIADCPYIQFYTEDSYDAIARNMIRLR